jgi:hypothetical protein
MDALSDLSRMLPSEIFCTHVVGYLNRQETCDVMKIRELEVVFGLEQVFCADHGTRLVDQVQELIDQDDGDDDDDDDDDEVTEEVATEEQEEDESIKEPDKCADCVMMEIDHFRCGRCDGFSHDDELVHCDGCNRQCCERACGVLYCDDCEKMACPDCKDGKDWFKCNSCQDVNCFCAGYRCDTCNHAYCFEYCRDYTYCEVCKSYHCEECRDSLYCEICSESFCDDCKESFYCDTCNVTICSSCWNEYTTDCNACEERHCDECQHSIPCNSCSESFCAESGAFFLCEACDMFFCEACTSKESFDCIDCNVHLCDSCLGDFTYFCDTCQVRHCEKCANAHSFARFFILSTLSRTSAGDVGEGATKNTTEQAANNTEQQEVSNEDEASTNHSGNDVEELAEMLESSCKVKDSEEHTKDGDV